MKRILLFSIILVLIVSVLLIGFFFVTSKFSNRGVSGTNANQTIPQNTNSENLNSNQPTTNTNTTVQTPKSDLSEPVLDYRARVTKKPFGVYITPQNSPVQPERFTGYHTGADAEYQDVILDVPVYAVADGTVVLSKTASGYGGVFMIEINLNGSSHTVLYGHIRPSSLPKIGQKVTKGDRIALLGTGYSTETDNERRHLHFAILVDNSLSILGYVANKSQLSAWLDPLDYY